MAQASHRELEFMKKPDWQRQSVTALEPVSGLYEPVGHVWHVVKEPSLKVLAGQISRFVALAAI